MISINSVEFNHTAHKVNTINYGGFGVHCGVQHNISLTVYSDGNIKFKASTPEQLILNELLLKEFGFGLDEIKKYFPEHFI